MSQPGSVAMADTTTLTGVLGPLVSGYLRRSVQISRIARRASAYGSTFRLEELHVHLDDGRVLELMFKDMDGAAAGASLVKPSDLHDPAREVHTYLRILQPLDVGAPACVGAIAQRSLSRYWLFLEWVNGAQLCHVGDFTIWELAARQLARMHARLRDLPLVSTQARDIPLPIHDAAFYRRSIDRACRNVLLHEHDASRRRVIVWLSGRYDRVVDELCSLPRTFVHGECYPSNILVSDEEASARICLVDWETAAIGAGALDLAALASGGWPEECRRALANAYRAQWQECGQPAWALDDLCRAIDCCRLYLAIQLLGWPAEWVPPAEHARDWLAEAAEIAERLAI